MAQYKTSAAGLSLSTQTTALVTNNNRVHYVRRYLADIAPEGLSAQ